MAVLLWTVPAMDQSSHQELQLSESAVDVTDTSVVLGNGVIQTLE
jgi:hypothetical protein